MKARKTFGEMTPKERINVTDTMNNKVSDQQLDNIIDNEVAKI